MYDLYTEIFSQGRATILRCRRSPSTKMQLFVQISGFHYSGMLTWFITLRSGQLPRPMLYVYGGSDACFGRRWEDDEAVNYTTEEELCIVDLSIPNDKPNRGHDSLPFHGMPELRENVIILVTKEHPRGA